MCVCVHGMCHAFASKCLIKVFSESSTDCTSLQEFIDLILLDAASLCVCVFVALCASDVANKSGFENKIFRQMEIVSALLFYGFSFFLAKTSQSMKAIMGWVYTVVSHMQYVLHITMLLSWFHVWCLCVHGCSPVSTQC